MNELQTVEKHMSFGQMKEQADLLVKSGFLPKTVNTAEKALTIMLTGRELGLGLMESIRSINVVNGRPCMSAQLLLALCRRTHEVEKAFTKETTDKRAVFVLQRKGSPAFESVFTREEADQAKFTMAWDTDKNQWKTKDNWAKQPATMLLWRAISKACRIEFPDAICGLYTPEEIADDLDVVDGNVTDIKDNKTAYTEERQKETEKAAESLPSMQGPNGLTNPVAMDQIGRYVPKPPFNTHYADKNIMEIYGVKTDTGKPKGKPFLEMLSKHSQDAEERAILTAFLEEMAHYEQEILK